MKSRKQARQSLAALARDAIVDDVFNLAHAQIVHVLIVLLKVFRAVYIAIDLSAQT